MAINAHHERLFLLAARLDQYARRYEARKDSRAVFTHTYTLITRTLAQKITDLRFDDVAWVVSLAEAFARHYFLALDAFDQGGDTPKAWAEVFRVLKIKNTSVLEDLVFAMTAHIVNDLPLALVDVGLADSEQRSHVHDFHTMNDVLGSNIKDIEDNILKRYEPALSWLDNLGHGYDQILTNYGFRLSRGMAWYNAVRLLDPLSSGAAKDSIERSAVQLIDNVRNPPVLSLRIVYSALRYVAALFRRWPKQ
jgi:hypothetical protein